MLITVASAGVAFDTLCPATGNILTSGKIKNFWSNTQLKICMLNRDS